MARWHAEHYSFFLNRLNLLQLKQLLQLHKIQLAKGGKLLLREKGIVIIIRAMKVPYLKIILALLDHSCTDSCCSKFFLATFRGTPLRGVVRSAIFCKVFKQKVSKLQMFPQLKE